MRLLLLLGVLLVGGAGFSGCSSAKIEEPNKLVEYNKERDGEPVDIGPGGGKAKGPKGKKGGGVVAADDGAVSKPGK